jgi:hypothetical protein
MKHGKYKPLIDMQSGTYANMFAKYNIVEIFFTYFHFVFVINEVSPYIIQKNCLKHDKCIQQTRFETKYELYYGRMQTIDVGAKGKQLPFHFDVYFEGSPPIRRTLGHYVRGAPQL